MKPTSYQNISLEIIEGVAVITLNRPEVLNAFSSQLGKELESAYKFADGEDSIRAVVLTGQGKAFCAGADFSGGPKVFSSPKAPDEFRSDPFDFHAWDVRKPVIAAVNGHAIGMGLTIAMQCDIRFMARGAKYGVVQVRRGIFPDLRSHWTIPRCVGASIAAEILLTGRTFDGQEAKDWGLASRCLDAEEVLPAAMELAKDVAQNVAPLSAGLSKRLLWQDLPTNQAVNEFERLAHIEIMASSDPKEGVMAWLEKRPPKWETSISNNWPQWADNQSK